MLKDFDSWNKKKKEIQKDKRVIYFHEREIWWCSLGVNIGFEQDGSGHKFYRPIIIFKKFNKSIFWAVPLTTTYKKGPYYFSFNFQNKVSTALLTQLRIIDCKRLIVKMGFISGNNFIDLKTKLRELFP